MFNFKLASDSKAAVIFLVIPKFLSEILLDKCHNTTQGLMSSISAIMFLSKILHLAL